MYLEFVVSTARVAFFVSISRKCILYILSQKGTVSSALNQSEDASMDFKDFPPKMNTYLRQSISTWPPELKNSTPNEVHFSRNDAK